MRAPQIASELLIPMTSPRAGKNASPAAERVRDDAQAGPAPRQHDNAPDHGRHAVNDDDGGRDTRPPHARRDPKSRRRDDVRRDGQVRPDETAGTVETANETPFAKMVRLMTGQGDSEHTPGESSPTADKAASTTDAAVPGAVRLAPAGPRIAAPVSKSSRQASAARASGAGQRTGQTSEGIPDTQESAAEVSAQALATVAAAVPQAAQGRRAAEPAPTTPRTTTPGAAPVRPQAPATRAGGDVSAARPSDTSSASAAPLRGAATTNTDAGGASVSAEPSQRAAQGPAPTPAAASGAFEAAREVAQADAQLAPPGAQTPRIQAAYMRQATSSRPAGAASAGVAEGAIQATTSAVAGEQSAQSAGPAGQAGQGDAPASTGPAGATTTDQITDAARLSDLQANRQVVVRLDPPELGQVRLTLRSSGRQIHGVLEVETSRAAAELQQAVPPLIQRLAEAGIQMRRLDIVQSGPSDRTGGDAPQSQQQTPEGSFAQQQQARDGGPSWSTDSPEETNSPAESNSPAGGPEAQPASHVSDQSINVWI